MSEMIERVAMALAADFEEGFPRFTMQRWEQLTELARATMRQRAFVAIQAMREPTPQMLAAVAPIAMVAPDLNCYDLAAEAIALLPQNDNPDIADVLAQMVQDHRAMIDEALK